MNKLNKYTYFLYIKYSFIHVLAMELMNNMQVLAIIILYNVFRSDDFLN